MNWRRVTSILGTLLLVLFLLPLSAGAAGTGQQTAVQIEPQLAPEAGAGPDVNATLGQDSAAGRGVEPNSGMLQVSPTSIRVTLDMGASTTVPMTVTNLGDQAASYTLVERDRGWRSALKTALELPAPRARLEGYDPNAPTTAGILAPGGTQPANRIRGAGDILAQWWSGLASPWGVGYSPAEDAVWLSNPLVQGGDDLNHEFTAAGAATGRTASADFGGFWAADMEYNPNTGRFWQVDVSGDNCLHEWFPASGPTGNTICGAAWTTTSQRGVAYDPETDTYFVGGWNSMSIYHIDNTGAVLTQWIGVPPVAGLAFNTESDLLFILENSTTDAVSVMDIHAGSIINTFTIPMFGNYSGGGLAIDCDGNLWAVQLHNKVIYLVDSGVPASLCSPDVPWLSESPVTGTVPAYSSTPVDISFDASVPEVKQPGDYFATLELLNDTPYAPIQVPVTMTVMPDPNTGHLSGQVLDFCSGAPVEATVGIVNGDPITQTASDPDTGDYTAWLFPGTYTLVFNAPGYVFYSTQATIVAGQTTQLDAYLVPDRPCISVNPTSLEVWLTPGTESSVPLEISSIGAQDLEFLIGEYSGTSGLLDVSLPVAPVAAPEGTAIASVQLPIRAVSTATTPTAPDAVAPPAGTNAGPHVLVVCSDISPCGPIVDQLLAIGGLGAVDVYDAQSLTPSLAELHYYDVVLTWSNYPYGDPALMGDVLADYVDAGGHVIDLMFAIGTHAWRLQGRFMDQDYTAINGTSILSGNSCLGDHDPLHPVLAGVTDVCDQYRLSGTYLTAGSSEVARWQDGELLVGVKDNGTVASIAGYVGADGGWGGQMDLLVWNAIIWLAGQTSDVPWLAENPVTGTVPAGTTLVDSVTFTALPTMTIGTYSATLVIHSNDVTADLPRVQAILHIVEQFVLPEARFASATSACVSTTLVFSNTSTPGIPPQTTYLWSFGDGATSTEESPAHAYAADGTYTVTLQACNQAGCDNSSSVVEVFPSPTAGFTYVAQMLQVSFTNTSTGGVSYQWDFGDGQTSTETNPVHTFATEGNYTVTFQVIGACGQATYSEVVDVTSLYTVYIPLVMKGNNR